MDTLSQKRTYSKVLPFDLEEQMYDINRNMICETLSQDDVKRLFDHIDPSNNMYHSDVVTFLNTASDDLRNRIMQRVQREPLRYSHLSDDELFQLCPPNHLDTLVDQHTYYEVMRDYLESAAQMAAAQVPDNAVALTDTNATSQGEA